MRIIESHNSLTGLIIENVNIKNKGELNEFDGMWSSSLTTLSQKVSQIINQ